MGKILWLYTSKFNSHSSVAVATCENGMPNAKITFDKFHIMKIINEGVDQVRRKEAANNPLLKGTRYVFLKNNENLTAYQITSDDKSYENNQASLGGHYMVDGKQNK